jgi:hypothetical protein
MLALEQQPLLVALHNHIPGAEIWMTDYVKNR